MSRGIFPPDFNFHHVTIFPQIPTSRHFSMNREYLNCHPVTSAKNAPRHFFHKISTFTANFHQLSPTNFFHKFRVRDFFMTREFILKKNLTSHSVTSPATFFQNPDLTLLQFPCTPTFSIFQIFNFNFQFSIFNFQFSKFLYLRHFSC